MAVILITNDDGIQADGIQALAEIVRELGEIYIIAPDRESSGVSHALTLNQPLRVHRVNSHTYSIPGTPSDCVHLGVHRLLPAKPDLVLSGINQGLNLGDDVTYSGTVCAAFEAAVHKIPSVAVSIAKGSKADYLRIRGWVKAIAAKVLDEGLPERTFLNVNFPSGPVKGVRFTVQGKGGYQGKIIEKKDPRGRKYYWIGGSWDNFGPVEPGMDFHAVRSGFISITPLHLDLTDYPTLKKIASWEIEPC